MSLGEAGRGSASSQRRFLRAQGCFGSVWAPVVPQTSVSVVPMAAFGGLESWRNCFHVRCVFFWRALNSAHQGIVFLCLWPPIETLGYKICDQSCSKALSFCWSAIRPVIALSSATTSLIAGLQVPALGQIVPV
jgi:hypothetical protein